MRGLLALPNELLLLILANFDDDDLLQHVAYYKLCARTRTCYSSTPPELWERLARANGLGLSCLEKGTKKKWKKIAFECAEHAWACDDPYCGMDRLRENRLTIREVQEDWPEWDCIDTVDEQQGVLSTSLFSQISFNNRFPNPASDETARSHNVAKCASLKPDSRDLMERHPIALRTFATFPPLETLEMENVGGPDVTAENVDGITVHDVLIAMSEVIGLEMTCAQLDELITQYGDDSTGTYFPFHWSLSDVLSAAPYIGSWFQLSNWEGLEILDDAAVCDFTRKKLPCDVEEHFRDHHGRR